MGRERLRMERFVMTARLPVVLEERDVQMVMAAMTELQNVNRSHAQNVRARFHDPEGLKLAKMYDDIAFEAGRVFHTVQSQTLAYDNVTWGV